MQVRSATYFPPAAGDAWECIEPGDAGWDRRLLDAAAGLAGERNSTGFIVLLNGRILAERYWSGANEDTVRDVASAQKSATSVLVGIAQGQGLLRIDEPSSAILGEGWSQAPPMQERRILWRHHLSMCTGLDEDLVPEAEPGTAWYYNNRAYHLVKTGLERAVGRPLDAWSREVLWGRIGMRATRWETRVAPAGVPRNLFAFGPEDAPFSALMTTVRDMARFGLLVQDGGAWAGEAVLRDTAFLDAATQTSQPMNPAYGYLFWLNGKESYLRPMRQPGGRGPLIPSAPVDLICALGAGDQKTYVSRSLGVVVARQGSAAGEVSGAMSAFDDALWSKLMAAAPAQQP
jgi:CubicO group peptidase (beta-lactamase class C family)